MIYGMTGLYGHSMGATSAIPAAFRPLFTYWPFRDVPREPWEVRYADFCRRLAAKRDLTKMEAGQ